MYWYTNLPASIATTRKNSVQYVSRTLLRQPTHTHTPAVLPRSSRPIQMDFIPATFALLIIFGALLYYLIQRRRNYWLNYNIPHVPESFFFLGRSQQMGLYYRAIYERFRNCGHPFVGCFGLFSPNVLVLDLDLIKRVLITDFESFPDRGFYVNIKDDPLSLNLSRVKGRIWRRLRAIMSQAFTSGKMKLMFVAKIEIANRFVETLNEQLLPSAGKNQLEMRDLCARYTTDVIGSVAFGIECNSLKNPETEFRIYGDKARKSHRPLVEIFALAYPNLCRRLHIKAFSDELIEFYSNIVHSTLALREKEQIRRNDFVDILIEMNKKANADGEPMLTMNEMIGQMFLFMVVGFETSSNTMAFCLYQLSRNQAIQQKARDDIEKTLQRFDGQLTYECVLEMHYLRQVIDETLRMHPVAPILRRIVRKRYLVPNTSIYLEEGQAAWIPIYAIHHDPEYYPEPETFEPERFSTEEVRKRHPMAYLPFGSGPRGCIAERFGKMQVLLGIAMLLKHFRFTPSERTPEKLEYNASETIILKVNNMFLNVEKVV